MRGFIVKIAVVLVMIQPAAYSEKSPLSLASDERVKVVSYAEDNVVSIRGTTFVNTQIVFGDDELIQDVQSGDSTSWTVFVNKNIPYILNLKPTVVNSDSDMTIITLDKEGKHRRYYFHLISNENKKDLPITYAVKFSYPLKEQAQMASSLNFSRQQEKAVLSADKHPENYNWDYTFSGSKRIVPEHVFDDGRFTYMKLRDNQPIPAIFAVEDKQGDESVVNYRRKGDYLIILRVSPQFTLRDGQNTVASIFNKKLVTQYKENA